MGGIDLDPATSDAQRARSPVTATNYFTIENNGLNQPWCGCLFCNPPYARGVVNQFTAKMVASYLSGEMQQGILLVNSSTDTNWWQHIAHHCDAICFHKQRVRFLKVKKGELTRGKSSPSHPSTIFYFGPNATRFVQVFSAMGTAIKL